MRYSEHYMHRAAARGFSVEYGDFLHEHGDYLEQKGDSYVLRLTDQERIARLSSEYCTQEQEIFHRKKLLRRKIKKSGLSLVSGEKVRESLDDQLRETSNDLKKVKKTKKMLKKGYAVFSRDQSSLSMHAITVAPAYKNIRHCQLIKE